MVVLFTDELDAAKRVNQLCEEFEIPPKFPEISAIPDQQYQKRELTSQYKGVTWNRKRTKWCVLLCLGGKRKYGGLYKDELDAAKRVNQLCEELRIPFQNPEVSATPQYQKKGKTSQYKGVYWHRKMKMWYARVYWKGNIPKYGGIFKNELNAAKRVK